ncbi:GGDEF domain-containing protein [Actinoplanes sp. NPDC023801]|uniref:GGDEF domain-containing protein n=1 Tax=Actinoplanes sp. NPDC023801 TaxID=3154595 RepID=UPI0033D439F2
MHTASRRMPRWLRRTTRGLSPVHLALGALYLAVLVLSGVNLVTGLSWYEPAAGLGRFAFGVCGLVAAVRAARTAKLPPRLRQVWAAVAAGFSVPVVTVPLLMILESGETSHWDDAAHVVFVAALIIALLRFPLTPTTRRERLRTAVDALTVTAGAAVVLWYTTAGPLLELSEPSAGLLVSAVAHPLAGLLLLFSAVRALLRGAGEPAQRPLWLLTAGSLVLFAGDAVHGYLNGPEAAGTPASWQFVCRLTADALIMAAAVTQSRAAAGAAGTEPRHGFGSGRCLPFLFVAVAYLLMLAQAWSEQRFFPWGGFALGGAMLTVLVVYRQILVQRESDERALRDGLTGLGNRTRFRQVSHLAISRGVRTGRHMAILVIDMNGFKEINDSLGHRTGDRVLAEFAEVLRRCVPEHGVPVRLGGDEFAVVLPEIRNPGEAYEVAGRIAASLGPVAVDGRLVTLAAGIGVAVAASGELGHDEIVHRAGLAMYKAKSLGPQTRWAIWQESLESSADGDLAAAA